MDESEDMGRIVRAGVLAGLAFMAEQWVDQRIWPDGYSDMKLLGMAVTRKSPAYWAVAVPWHLLNSVGFALLYARVVGPRLPGPGPLRGAILALAENNGLWFPGLPVINRVHPAIRDGSVRPLQTGGVDWLVGNLRHLALGLVLGALCPVRSRPTSPPNPLS
ncbi:MAG: hypothetical protein M3Z04_00515 [Chloroflexota bacterium]|nr:hypothetical protein [Chloroflexota bacterium]